MSTMLLVFVCALTAAPAENRAEAAIFFRRGNDAMRAGKPDDAIREYQKAYDLFPSPKVLYNLGQAYMTAERKAEAISTFRTFIRTVEEPAFDGRDELAVALASARLWARELEAELGVLASSRPEQKPLPKQESQGALRGQGPGEGSGLPPARLQINMNSSSGKVGSNPGFQAVSVPHSERTKLRAGVWWAVALGAVAAATATFVVLSMTQHKDGCPPSADLGCI